jgi:hypothetical protein
VLEEEFRQPSVYFSPLEELSKREHSVGDLAAAVGRRSTDLNPYLGHASGEAARRAEQTASELFDPDEPQVAALLCSGFEVVAEPRPGEDEDRRAAG